MTKNIKTSIIILLFIVMSATISSCSQCQECSDENESITTTVCREDYSSNADYQAALLALEELGAECR